jgi:hypothetical protein
MEMGERDSLESGHPVQVTVLEQPEIELAGRVVESGGRRLRLVVDRPIQPGTAVKVGFQQTLLLGEVCGCQPEGHQFRVALELEHSLVQTDELVRLAQKLLEEGSGAAPEQPVDKKKSFPPLNRSARVEL